MENGTAAPIRTAVVGFGISGKVFHTPLIAADRNYSLDVIGDGPLRHALTHRAEDLGIAGNVRFLGARDDVRAQLPGHRLYVHSARREAFGICLIEAMAAGLPVLATPVGGIPEVLDGGRAGALWPLDDPAEAMGTEAERQMAFDQALRELAVRIHTFLPLAVGHRR